MAKLVKSITYKPKIPPFLDGRCTQTIRKGNKVSVNDEILFHGWAGKPRHSKWDWSKRVTVTEVIPVEISKEGIFIDGILHVWTSWYPTLLAEYDFIEPATGEELRDVLFKLSGVPKEPTEYQIIRWD